MVETLSRDYPNDYEVLATEYQRTHEKPDKLYSILPTVLKLAGDTRHKTILDLGCGDGFFAKELAKESTAHVVGIDNSPAQIKLATEHRQDNLEFMLADALKDHLPLADIQVVPFLLNYCHTVDELRESIGNLYSSLAEDGTLIAVVDLPNGLNLQKYGARKTLLSHRDGAPITLELFNQSAPICTLHSHYFNPTTIESTIKHCGFREIAWHKPMISQQGMEAFPKDFWEGYPQNCELGYLTAHK